MVNFLDAMWYKILTNSIEISLDNHDNALDSLLHVDELFQIAFVDLLRSLNLEPSYMLGHSLGEAACAYCDETLTAEETAKFVYLRNKVDSKSATLTETI